MDFRRQQYLLFSSATPVGSSISDSGRRSQRAFDLLRNCTSLPMTEDSVAKNNPLWVSFGHKCGFSFLYRPIFFILHFKNPFDGLLGSHNWFSRWDASSSLIALSHSLASG
ncbi:hypothetical protein T11_9226 [Trichinella zimbabwensis]|uniref:Uncharacterized protein n=1 Tax=Trichinella zimbabwensis TaxID=268475 RepID=A0A0V1HKW2_9BILA|nr:hypothetical protein T11_9226 [Trichinella zimbabwensis]